MKKGLAALLALMLVLSLAGCGKKDDPGDTGEDDAIPDAPIKLETLHVEFVKGERDVDDLLALKDMLPLVAALSERNVEVGSAAVTFGTSAEATAQALADGSVDVAFLPLTACFDHEDTITLALVQDADDGPPSRTAKPSPSRRRIRPSRRTASLQRSAARWRICARATREALRCVSISTARRTAIRRQT